MGKRSKKNRGNKNTNTDFVEVLQSHNDTSVIRMSADFQGNGGAYTPLFATSFNGEKTLGGVGPIRNYRPNYEALRLRSWQSYYENEVSHTIINAYIKWFIGKGLKAQCEPLVEVLRLENIDLNVQEFCRTVESRYQAWSKSNMSDYSNMDSKNDLSATALKNAKLGGDVLVVIRYINNCVNVQLIDASHVISPGLGTEYFPQILPNGNKVLNGIEMKPNGEHVAYYVRDYQGEFTRIESKNSLGLKCAYLYYGSKYRLDNVRGVPDLSNVLEKLASLERYGSAALGSAEERQKISYVMEPELLASPQNVLAKDLVKAHDYYKGISSQLPVDMQGLENFNSTMVQ